MQTNVRGTPLTDLIGQCETQGHFFGPVSQRMCYSVISVDILKNEPSRTFEGHLRNGLNDLVLRLETRSDVSRASLIESRSCRQFGLNAREADRSVTGVSKRRVTTAQVSALNSTTEICGRFQVSQGRANYNKFFHA
jgi:hypothetical protein